VTITIDGAGLVKIALASLVAGVNPLVQALSHANQRRYIVTNAGPVDTVKIFDTSVVPAVLKVTPFDNGILADKSIHTIVHLSG
jgi:hypothetical protein